MSAPAPAASASTATDAARAARYAAAFTSLSRLVFGVPTLCPAQSKALPHLFANERCAGTLLLVDRTGGGKSHVMRLSGVFLRGITLVCVPLLALAADFYKARSFSST